MRAKADILKIVTRWAWLCLFSIPGIAIQAQTGIETQTNSIVKITYPPLTEKEGKGLSLPIPPSGHPRLFLTKNDIPVLQRKLNDPVFALCAEKLYAASRISTDGRLQTADKKSNEALNIRNAIEAKALFYLISNEQALGREAVTALLNLYATIQFDSEKPDICRDIGRAIVTGAIIYDWCYPLLTPDEKQTLIGRMETLATTLEVKWPYLVQGSVTGHGVEAQLSRDMLSCGVAVYNENPEIYNRVAGRILAEFVPVRKVFYPAAYHHQGSAYGPYRYAWDLWATLIFDKLGYPHIFGADQAKSPYYFIYSRRPDGQLFRNGDDFIELFTPFGKYWNIGGSVEGYAGSYFKDAILVAEARKESGLGRSPDYLFDLLFFNPPDDSTTLKTSLPLTKYFAEPFGAMVARTGWEEGLHAATAMAEMKVNVLNYVNHQHLDAGSFQLYYKGPLAVQSGIYQGTTGGYGSEHFKNYSQRTIAHNTMLVYDPGQQFKFGKNDIVNDGGQPYPAGGAEARTGEEILSAYKTGAVLAHDFGPDATVPDYSYLKGEMALAYGAKVKSFQRSFVFLHLKSSTVPAALVVFDKVVAASPSFKKTWLLHCVEEPVINGNTSTAKRTEKGYGGQLQNTTLLPLAGNVSIQKIGGPGKEFMVGNKNFPQSPANPQNCIDSAGWRIEVSPKAASATDLFLNVMQVADAASNQMLRVEKIETADFIGAGIGNYMVLFSKTGSPVAKSTALTIRGDGGSNVLIADMEEGSWTIKDEKGKSFTKRVTKDARVLYITLKAGTYRLSKK